MANSTEVITDLHTLAGSTFTAASVAKAHATDNPDLAGMASGLRTDPQEEAIECTHLIGAARVRSKRASPLRRPGRSSGHRAISPDAAQ